MRLFQAILLSLALVLASCGLFTQVAPSSPTPAQTAPGAPPATAPAPPAPPAPTKPPCNPPYCY